MTSGSRALAVSLVWLPGLALLFGLAAWRGSPPSAQGLESVAEEPCVLTATRRVWPATLALEQETTVHMALEAGCDPNATPLHLVLVVDASADHMGDGQLKNLLSALRSAIESIRLEELGYLKIGVVLIADGGARVASFLTNSESQVLNALRVQRASGTECVSCGLAEALRVLRHGRSAGPVREAIFLATLGIGPASCQVVREGADALKAYGALVVTACAGRTCAWPCLTEAATSARFAFRSWEWTYVDERIRELVRSSGPAFHPIQDVELEDWLSDNLEYTGGGYPRNVIGNRLQWQFSPWPTEGISLSFRVRTLSCGRYAVSQDPPTALLTYNTTFWSKLSPARVSFPNPVVEVACPSPTPSGSETTTPEAPATATASATRATAASPTRAAPPPTVTPVVAPPLRFGKRYLPLLLRRGCPEWPGTLDVAVVVDVSGSMMEAPPDHSYASRLEAAASIGQAILGGLRPVEDQVTVVVYGDETMLQVLTPLGACCQAARQALSALPRYNGSRMDLAIAAAAAQLTGPAGRERARRTTIVLSDGDLNQTPAEDLVRTADAATAAGIVLQIVVLGHPSDMSLLRRAAGSPSRVHEARQLHDPEVIASLASLPRCGR